MSGIHTAIEELGFNEDAHKRLTFRTAYLIKKLKERQGILAAGNLASLEPELAQTNNIVEDLADTLFEFIVLLNITLNQKEQGPISPPNETAISSDSPEGE